MKEEWKDITGYEGLYQVSNLGDVKNAITGKNLKPLKEKKGYFQVNLSKEGKLKKYMVHRLVLETFKPIPDMHLKTSNGSYVMQVDHINNIKSDNRLENLQWLSGTQNQKKEHQRKMFKYNLKKILKEV